MTVLVTAAIYRYETCNNVVEEWICCDVPESCFIYLQARHLRRIESLRPPGHTMIFAVLISATETALYLPADITSQTRLMLKGELVRYLRIYRWYSDIILSDNLPLFSQTVSQDGSPHSILRYSNLPCVEVQAF